MENEKYTGNTNDDKARVAWFLKTLDHLKNGGECGDSYGNHWNLSQVVNMGEPFEIIPKKTPLGSENLDHENYKYETKWVARGDNFFDLAAREWRIACGDLSIKRRVRTPKQQEAEGKCEDCARQSFHCLTKAGPSDCDCYLKEPKQPEILDGADGFTVEEGMDHKYKGANRWHATSNRRIGQKSFPRYYYRRTKPEPLIFEAARKTELDALTKRVEELEGEG